MGPVLNAAPAAASSRPTVRRRALQHALWTLVPFLVVWLYCARERAAQPPSPDPIGLPHPRLLWYREHKTEFDLLWLGDSRTYCAMDPTVHDPLLGRHSVNMSIWGLWLPAQWAYFEDLLREVPPGTAICWSIGHINFNHGPKNLTTLYPLGFARAARYMAFGYDWADVRGNLVHFATALELPRRAAAWRDDVDRLLAVPLIEPSVPPAAEDPPEVRALRSQAEALLAQAVADPTTSSAKIVIANGRPTSIEAFTTRGAYRRFEVDSAFFRGKQAETSARAQAGAPASGAVSSTVGAAIPLYQPDPLLWATFEKILDLMAASGCKVIVNELEEAPHCYFDEQSKESVHRFMRDQVRQAVEARGLIYVRADLDRLRDEDYFDYNHLNTTGVVRFAPLLAEVLRPHLRRD